MIKPVFKKKNSAKKKIDTKSIFILDLLSNFRIFEMPTFIPVSNISLD